MEADTKASVVKAATAWGSVGISKVLSWFGIASWGDFAAMVAAAYSLLLIVDWVIKKRKSAQASKGST